VKENQQFTTLDTISVISLVCGVLVLVGSILSNSLIDRRESRAMLRTEQLAVQILAGGYKFMHEDSRLFGVNRVIASQPKVDIRPEGRIGMDPWGSPYYYRVIEDIRGDTFALVYSSGPNKKRESSDEIIAKEDDIKRGVLRLKGDDIGSLRKSDL
jgi:hypothetical protein